MRPYLNYKGKTIATGLPATMIVCAVILFLFGVVVLAAKFLIYAATY